MDAISFFNVIERIYNSVNDISVFDMMPFLVLEKLDEKDNPDGNLYMFKQFKGEFTSKPFNLGSMQLKEFTYITPLLYFKNKRIFSNIEKLLDTRRYSVFLSFKNHYTVRISLYANDILHIKNIDIKLFSNSIDLKFLDWFVYWFKLSKHERLKVKIEKAKRKLDILERIRKAEELIESPKLAHQKTKELLIQLRKKYRKDQKAQEDKILEIAYKEEISLKNQEK